MADAGPPGHAHAARAGGSTQPVVEELADASGGCCCCAAGTKGSTNACGRFSQPDEISIGDYILSGGEVRGDGGHRRRDPAGAGRVGRRRKQPAGFVFAIRRPAAIWRPAQYTRPREYRGLDRARGAAERQPRRRSPAGANEQSVRANRRTRRADLLGRTTRDGKSQRKFAKSRRQAVRRDGARKISTDPLAND